GTVAAPGILGRAEGVAQGRVIGQVQAGAIGGQQAKPPPADDVGGLAGGTLGQQQDQGNPEGAGHAGAGLGQGLLGDAVGGRSVGVVSGVLAAASLVGVTAAEAVSGAVLAVGVVDLLVQGGAVEVLVVLEGVQGESEQVGEGEFGVACGV